MAARRQFIYFAKPKRQRGPIKIGCTLHPKARLSGLMEWSPFEIELIVTVPGGFGTEAWLHHKFQASRKHGEWFAPTPELSALIKAVKASGRIYAAPFEDLTAHSYPGRPLRALLEKHGIAPAELAAFAGIKSLAGWLHTLPASRIGIVSEFLQQRGIDLPLTEFYAARAHERIEWERRSRRRFQNAQRAAA